MLVVGTAKDWPSLVETEQTVASLLEVEDSQEVVSEVMVQNWVALVGKDLLRLWRERMVQVSAASAVQLEASVYQLQAEVSASLAAAMLKVLE